MRPRNPLSKLELVISTLGILVILGLFVGAFVVTVVRAIATQKLVATWVIIIAAFGLQAMARVMAATVPMKAEIDATV